MAVTREVAALRDGRHWIKTLRDQEMRVYRKGKSSVTSPYKSTQDNYLTFQAIANTQRLCLRVFA